MKKRIAVFLLLRAVELMIYLAEWLIVASHRVLDLANAVREGRP